MAEVPGRRSADWRSRAGTWLVEDGVVAGDFGGFDTCVDLAVGYFCVGEPTGDGIFTDILRKETIMLCRRVPGGFFASFQGDKM